MIAAVERGDFLTAAAEIMDSEYAKIDVPKRARRNRDDFLNDTFRGLLAKPAAAPEATDDKPSDAAMVVLQRHQDTSPDQVAEERRHAQRVGIPFTSGGIEPVVEASKRLTLEEMLSANPVTAKALHNEELAAVAHDEVEGMTTLETAVASLQAYVAEVNKLVPRSARGIGKMYQSAGRLSAAPVKAAFEALDAGDLYKSLNAPLPAYLDPARSLVTLGSAGTEAIEAHIAPDPSKRNFTVEVAGGLGQVTGQIILAMVSGGLGSVVSLGTLAGQGGDIVSQEVEKAGKTGTTGGDAAILAGGAITAITEKVGLDLILNKIPAVYRNRIMRALAGFGVEASQEITEKVMQDLTLLGLVDPDREILGPGTAREGAVAGTVGAIVSTILPGRARTRSMMDMVQENAETLNINNRAPDLAADFREKIVAENGEFGGIFIPVEKAVEFAQQHEQGAPAGFAELGLDNGNLQVNENGEVEIPKRSFARNILGTENYAKVADHLRLEHDAPVQPVEKALAERGDDVLAAVEEDPDGTDAAKEAAKKLVADFAAGEEVDVLELLKDTPPAAQEVLDRALAKVQADTATDVSSTLTEGRRRRLEGQVASLDRQIETQADLLQVKQDAGLATRAVERKIETLNKRRDAAITDLTTVEDIVLSQRALRAPAEEAVARVGRSRVDVRGDQLAKLAVNVQSSAVRAVRTGFRQGLTTARKDQRAAQGILTKLINQSPLTAKDKGKFLVQVRNNDTLEKLEKNLPALQSRVTNLIEKQRKRELTSALRKVLKKAKTKNVGGKPKGKFTPEITRTLDAVRDALGTSKEAAAERLANLGGADTVPTVEQKLVNQALALKADAELVSSSSVEDLLLDVNSLVEVGKIARRAGSMAKLARQQKTRDAILAISGEPGDVNRSSLVESLINTEARLLGLNASWSVKWRRILGGTEAEVAAIEKELNLFQESRDFERGKNEMIAKFSKNAADIIGVKSDRGVLKQFQKDMDEKVNLGKFSHSDGSVRELIFTRAELRKRAMELRDPQLNEMVRDENSNAYTDEIIDAIEANLNEVDVRLIQMQLDFYADYYDRINEAYEKAYGVSLPRVEQYSPISREFGDGSPDEFLKTILYRGGIAPGSLKSRAPNVRPLLKQADYTTLISHITEMEYFRAYNDKVSFIDSVVNGQNGAVAGRIRAQYGTKMLQTIQNDINYFAKKGNLTSETFQTFFTALMRNFSFAQLGAKPQIGLKQLASFAAYAEGVKSKDIVEGMIKFASNPKKALRLLDKSEFFRQRGINIDQDFQDLVSSQGGSKLINFMGRNPSFTRVMMLPIRMGDKGAIAIGGFSHVHAKMKAGATEAEALKSFERLTVRTQQSSDPDQISELQRSSSIARILSQFMSSANALTRAEYQAIVDTLKGRISKAEGAKRVMIYHLVIPNLIQYIANGFVWDEDDQLQASLLGAMNGVFVLGDVVELAMNSLRGEPTLRGLQVRHPLVFFEDLIRAVKTFDADDISWEDFLDGSQTITSALKGVSGITGIPVNTLANQLRGFGQLAEGDVEEAAALTLGYSPFTIDKNEIGN
jgi:hypothetical protein